MSVFSGDFLGFTLGDIHSSQLNITRVSSGDRYDDNLLPNFKDITAETPGGDGFYYWDTFYQQKPFILNFAYDDDGEYIYAFSTCCYGSIGAGKYEEDDLKKEVTPEELEEFYKLFPHRRGEQPSVIVYNRIW